VRNRLLIALVGLVLVVLVTHDIPLTQHLKEIERDRLITSIQRDAYTISNQVSPYMGLSESLRETQIHSVIDVFAASSDGTAIVVDKSGYLIASTAAAFTVGADYATRPEVAAALLGTPTFGTRLSNTIGGELLYVAVPVLSGAQVEGVVRVTIPTAVLDAGVQNQLNDVYLAGIATILLAVIVAFVFARSVSDPLSKLRKATEELAEGDLKAFAQPGGPSEVKQLAKSFNEMASRIRGLLDRQRSFSADASHQLRTPLTALRLRLEQAVNSVETSPQTALNHLEEALSETDRLTHLVEQLLQLSRAEGSTLPKSTMDISAFMMERYDEWSYLASERGIVVEQEIENGLVALTSAIAVREIIDNYVDNAFDASSPAGAIWLIAQKIVGGIELTVRDRGKGMTLEQRVNAFERFWRGAGDANRRAGSGLGLAIVAQLAQAGGLSVELRESPTGGVDAVLIIPGAN
jgi:signal transduction histidine kinase